MPKNKSKNASVHFTPHDAFLRRLQTVAKEQVVLSQSHPIPKKLEWITSWVGTHPWQTLVVLATVSTLLQVVLR